MLLNILKQLNWVDLFILIILWRVIYIAFKTGFIPELFKLIGIILSIYISMHYYTGLSDFIRGRIDIDSKVPLEFLDFFCFSILAILSYLFSVLLREAFCRLIKTEAVPALNRMGGIIIGGVRAILTASLFVFLLTISSVSYLKVSAEDAYLSRRIFNVAPNTYKGIWKSVVSKFATKEKFNDTIRQVQENF